MDNFDNYLIKVYNFFETTIQGIRNVISVSFVNALFELFERLNAAAIFVSTFVLLAATIKAYFDYGLDILVWLIFIGPILLLLFSFLSEGFHEACEALIKNNPTYISNQAYLTFTAVFTFLSSVLLFLIGIYALIEDPMRLGTLANSGIIVFSIYLLVTTAPLFNPALINLNVSKESSAADDLIGLMSLNLKSVLFQEKLLSRILILMASLIFIWGIFDSDITMFFGALGILSLGIFFPLIAYLVFIFFYAIYSVFQAILHIPKLNK